MSDTNQGQLIAEIARDIVGRIAPHELPLFRATSEAYFKRAARSFKGQRARDEMLGFGTGKEVTFLTPVVLAVTNAVVGFVAAEISTSNIPMSPDLAGDLLRSAFQRNRSAEPADQPGLLVAAQIAQARQLAFEKACQFNLNEARAHSLADSLAASMAGASS
jgi:hypothetical protein